MVLDHRLVLKSENLFVGYSLTKGPLFKDLNINVRKGELVCFMGPNGVGKSTLIRTLSGLQKPLCGSITLNTSISSTTYKNIAVVLTERPVVTNMNVYELISLGRYPYLDWKINLAEADIEIIDKVIHYIGLASLIDTKVNELSDGQLQLVMIARALAQDTPIVILDEPTAHLDLNNRVRIMKLLHDLTRSLDKAVILATHELDLALQTADVIWLTGEHQNIIQGIPEDLVLDGSFDNVFKFKGYDLKTGKMQHNLYRSASVHIKGEGYSLLWTKNALERNGYTISEHEGDHTLVIHTRQEGIEWKLDDEPVCSSIAAVLTALHRSI